MRPVVFVVLAGVFSSLLGLGCRTVPLRPGTGGLRVRISGARSGVSSTVSIRTGGSRSRVPATVLVTSTSEALFTDLAPNFYEVSVASADGRGGYYSSIFNSLGPRVEVGRVTDATVSLDQGLAATGTVVDSLTGTPLNCVSVRPPPRLASVTWPTDMPNLWAETQADGKFALGGIPPEAPITPGEARTQSVGTWLTFDREGYVPRQVPLTPAADAQANWHIALEPARQDAAPAR